MLNFKGMVMIDKFTALLSEGEKPLIKARIHKIVFAPAILNTALALLVAIFFHPLVGAVIMFLNIYPIYNAIVNYHMTYLILTNQKVMSRAGYLSRDWITMDFDRIENAYLEEPIIGRSLGYSTVIISGVGSGSIAVKNVENGDRFVKALEQELAKNRHK
jgi:uncharacterized membrane protein YdbT with pleckstrin-like domain